MSGPTFNRREFVMHSTTSAVAAGVLGQAQAAGGAGGEGEHFICVTCGTQFAASPEPPARCSVCEDERQYVGWKGQQWTTLARMQGKYRNTLEEVAPDLHTIHTEPHFAIGQQAYLVRTPKGNVLWDCVTFLDEATHKAVEKLGGISAIAVSHPHYYTTMVEWSRAFGGAPVHLHKADAKWVMRPDEVIRFWEGETHRLMEGLTLANSGGHFEGFQVLHSAAGAGGRGALLAGDQPQVCMDRRWVAFMYSYPNYIPLGPAAVRRVLKSLEPFPFEVLYGAFPGRVVARDAQAAVARSAERHLRRVGA
jgi:hypothetical protein